MRAKSTGEVRLMHGGAPSVDGFVLKQLPVYYALAGQNNIPHGGAIIVGTTTMDGLIVPVTRVAGPFTKFQYTYDLKSYFGSSTSQIEKLYPAGSHPQVTYAQINADLCLVCGTTYEASLWSRAKVPVYMYSFGYGVAVHGSEVPMVFGWKTPFGFGAKAPYISRTMMSYWTQLAKTANPNGGGTPKWAKWTDATSPYMYFDNHGAKQRTHFKTTQCNFWKKRQENPKFVGENFEFCLQMKMPVGGVKAMPKINGKLGGKLHGPTHACVNKMLHHCAFLTRVYHCSTDLMKMGCAKFCHQC